jgi:hypothetical protein
MQRFFILSLLFLFSCSRHTKNVVQQPDDLIPQNKMVQVLADVHLLEATLSVRSPIPSGRNRHLPPEFSHDSVGPVSMEPQKKDTLPYYNIFEHYKITSRQYESSMAWYTANPEKLNDLYDLVIIELTKRQTEDKLGKKGVMRNDSAK